MNKINELVNSSHVFSTIMHSAVTINGQADGDVALTDSCFGHNEVHSFFVFMCGEQLAFLELHHKRRRKRDQRVYWFFSKLLLISARGLVIHGYVTQLCENNGSLQQGLSSMLHLRRRCLGMAPCRRPHFASFASLRPFQSLFFVCHLIMTLALSVLTSS